MSVPASRIWFERFWNSKVFTLFLKALWVGGVFVLPLTSFPLLLNFSGASTVAPPANIFFLGLAALWLLPHILNRGRIPVESYLLAVFILVVFISWAASFYLEIPPFRDISPLGRSRSAWITLIMGSAAFLLPASWLLANPNNLRLTLRVLNWSGLLVIAWSFVQAYFVFFQGSQYPPEIVRFQLLFSDRSMPLFYSRVTGFAYEPSWLAHQMTMVYLPLWLSATLLEFTAHSRRLGRLSFENFLLAAGLLVLFLSFSRVGILSFLLVGLYLAVQGNLWLSRRLSRWFLKKAQTGPAVKKALDILLTILLLTAFLAVYLSAIVGLTYLGSFVEPRLQRFFTTPLFNGSWYEITNQLAFAERVIYWSSGWAVFNDYPVLGVGLGNAGFFFPEKMPTYGYGLWEVSQMFNYLPHLPNPKSMWVRILAETGLIGFSVFLTWYYLLWKSGKAARSSSDRSIQVVGWGGQMVLIGFLVEGFSIDSFALPYFWFAMGLLAAAAALARAQHLDNSSQELSDEGKNGR